MGAQGNEELQPPIVVASAFSLTGAGADCPAEVTMSAVVQQAGVMHFLLCGAVFSIAHLLAGCGQGSKTNDFLQMDNSTTNGSRDFFDVMPTPEPTVATPWPTPAATSLVPMPTPPPALRCCTCGCSVGPVPCWRGWAGCLACKNTKGKRSFAECNAEVGCNCGYYDTHHSCDVRCDLGGGYGDNAPGYR